MSALKPSEQRKVDYKILGLTKKDDPMNDLSQVRKSYKELSLKHHPNKGGNAEKFLELTESYERVMKYLAAKIKRVQKKQKNKDNKSAKRKEVIAKIENDMEKARALKKERKAAAKAAGEIKVKRVAKFNEDSGAWKMMREDMDTETELAAYNKIRAALQKHRETRLPYKKKEAAKKIQGMYKRAVVRDILQKPKRERNAARKIQGVVRGVQHRERMTPVSRIRGAGVGKIMRSMLKNIQEEKEVNNAKKMAAELKKMMEQRKENAAKEAANKKKIHNEVMNRLVSNIVSPVKEGHNNSKPVPKKGAKVSKAALEAAKRRKPKVPEPSKKIVPLTKAQLRKLELKQKRETKHSKTCRCGEGIKTHFVKWESYTVGGGDQTKQLNITTMKPPEVSKYMPPIGEEITIKTGKLKGMKGIVEGKDKVGHLLVRPEQQVIDAGIEQLELPVSIIKYKKPKVSKAKHVSGNEVVIPHAFTYLEVCRDCGMVYTDTGETSMLQPGEDGRYQLGGPRRGGANPNAPTAHDMLVAEMRNTI